MTNARVKSTIIRGNAAKNAGSAFASGPIAEFDIKTAVPKNPLEMAEAARITAVEQGYNDGLNAAREEIETAMNESNKRVRRAVAALTEAVNGFDQRQTVAIADVEDEIIKTAFLIAASVLQREVSLATDPGGEAIARALALTPGREAAVARINPDDAATLNVTELPTNGRPLEVIADPSVEPGGCIIEVGNTSIDAQISSTLANVATALGL